MEASIDIRILRIDGGRRGDGKERGFFKGATHQNNSRPNLS